MKTEEDEAFDDLAKRQGAWGGGFKAKQAMAADKYSDIVSDGGLDPRNKMDAQPAQDVDYWIREATAARQAEMALRRELEAQPAQEPVTESETLKLALEALEEYADQEGKTRAADEAITAIKAALAQPADKLQEDLLNYGTSWSIDGKRIDPMSVYKEPAHCQCTACKDGVIHASDCAVHNAPAYPAGKCDCDARLSKYAETLLEENNMPNTPTARAVYRKMSERIEDDDDIQDYKKPWVGLTDEEIDKTYWRREPFRRPTQFEFARDIEQLLKEKNGV